MLLAFAKSLGVHWTTGCSSGVGSVACQTEKWVRVPTLGRALNMNDGRCMKAAHKKACMRMH